MKLVRWLRFSWELERLSEPRPLPEAQYAIRPAARGDMHAVHEVLISAFTLDSDWNDTLHSLRDIFDSQIETAFNQKEIPVLILTRGNRAVGASVLALEPDAESHLISGPAIVNEYRNRGLGAALLQASLFALREAGLTRAHAITKHNVPTAKFLYTKFKSTVLPYDMVPKVANTKTA